MQELFKEDDINDHEDSMKHHCTRIMNEFLNESSNYKKDFSRVLHSVPLVVQKDTFWVILQPAIVGYCHEFEFLWNFT